MDCLLREVVEDFGLLEDVMGCYQDPPSTSVKHFRYDAIELQFEKGSFTIDAVPSDDTIAVTAGPSTLPFRASIATIAPWKDVIGKGALWIWMLENQGGFTDGIQIEFRNLGASVGIQMVCEASSLTLFRVDRI